MLTAADMLMGESAASEAAEPKVEASPKMGRDRFNYLEPRPGIDGKQYFRQCASCESFVPEAAMGGAVTGARCARFGSTFSVTDDDTCNLWWGWQTGRPCEAVIDSNAAELRKGIPGGFSPYSVGYQSQCDAKCRTCRFIDWGAPEVGGREVPTAECEAYECLNEKAPDIFMLNKAINPGGGCTMWQRPDPPQESTNVVAMSR